MNNLLIQAIDIIPAIYKQLYEAAQRDDELSQLGQVGEKQMFNSRSNILKICYNLFAELKSFDRLWRYGEMRKSYNLDPEFSFNGEGIYLYGEGQISIGAESYIGRHSSIQAYKDCTVTIGKKCRISNFVKIYTMNAEADQDFSKDDLELRTGNVTIGDYCWIGAGVLIREGVEIGENSVIGANSVVTANIPPYSIAAGNPARVIKRKSCAAESPESLPLSV